MIAVKVSAPDCVTPDAAFLRSGSAEKEKLSSDDPALNVS